MIYVGMGNRMYKRVFSGVGHGGSDPGWVSGNCEAKK